MAVLPVQLIPPTFPEGYCPPSLQQFANDLQSGTQLSSGISLDTLVISDTAPADHSKAWFKTVGGIVTAASKLFVWSTALSLWVAPNPEQDLSARRLWAGALGAGAGNLDEYDGGSTAAVGPATGPMWEEDPTFVGRSPMHPGIIPTANPAKTLTVGEDYGEGAHLMTAQEVAPHNHALSADASITNVNGSIKTVTTGAGGPGLAIGLTAPPSTDLAVVPNAFTTTQQAMPVIHPVRGIYVIRRTARIFYVS